MGVSPIRFRLQDVLPPNALYVSEDDFLRVSIYTTASTSGLSLGLRRLAADGVIHNEVENLDGVSLSTLTTKTFRLGEGFLLGAVVSNMGGGLADGATFISIGLQRGSPNTLPYQLLAQDYVTNLFCVEWPAAAVRRAEPSSQVSGTPFAWTLANPAAGAELVWTVPAGTTYSLLAFLCQFSTSAVAGNRYNYLIIDDGIHTLWLSDLSALTGPNANNIYIKGAPGHNAATWNQVTTLVSLPAGVALGAGWRVRTSTSGIDVGDQYTNAALTVIKWA